MTGTEPQHLSFGTPMSEWISRVGELDIDAVGLWQIVANGRRGFGLEGPALDDFLRRSLMAHFAYGAFPVRHVPGDPTIWTVQTNYGETPETMAHAIVTEWIDRGRPDPSLGDLWLATPQIAKHQFKKQSSV
jgi:hypothetical protein